MAGKPNLVLTPVCARAAAGKAAITAQKEYEMIWSVGLRGLNDYAYPNCVQDSAGADGCGEIISQAVANQTALLVELTGTPVEDLQVRGRRGKPALFWSLFRGSFGLCGVGI